MTITQASLDELKELATQHAPCVEPCSDPGCALARKVLSLWNIERNKRDGLLCACNKVRVPYYPEPDHGTLTVESVDEDGVVSRVVHGYDDCAKE